MLRSLKVTENYSKLLKSLKKYNVNYFNEICFRTGSLLMISSRHVWKGNIWFASIKKLLYKSLHLLLTRPLPTPFSLSYKSYIFSCVSVSPSYKYLTYFLTYPSLSLINILHIFWRILLSLLLISYIFSDVFFCLSY